jgi:YD repeat-containing protein
VAGAHGDRRHPHGQRDAGFTLTFHRVGQTWTFTGDGWNTARADRNGNRLVRQARSGRFDTVVDTQQRVTSFRHSGERLERVTDPAGRAWLYRYHPDGRLDTVEHPDGTYSIYRYGANGRLTWIASPGGSTTTIGYHPDGRVATITRVTDPATGAGPTTRYTYAPLAGLPDDPSVVGKTTVTDPNGHATTHYHDAAGRVTRTVDALGRTRSTGYSANSDVRRLVAASGTTTTMTYSTDGRDNLTVDAGTGPGAGDRRLVEALGYADPAHPYYPTSHTNAQGHATTYHYDANGNRDSVTDATPQRGVSGVTYTPHGTIDFTTDPNGVRTDHTWTYAGPGGPVDRPEGPLQRLVIDHPAPLGDQTITYDGLGRVASVTDGKGQVTTYTWPCLTASRVSTTPTAARSGSATTGTATASSAWTTPRGAPRRA